MAPRVVFSTAARQNLASAVDWLTQPGSGHVAHRKVDDLINAMLALPDSPYLYPEDPDRPPSRLAIIHGYAVRFRIRADGGIFVQRIFGPKQRR